MSVDPEYIKKEKKHWEEVCNDWDLWDGYNTKDFKEVINSDWVTFDLLKKIGNNLIDDSDSYEKLYNSLSELHNREEEEYNNFAEKIYEMTKLDKSKDNHDVIELKKNIKKLFKGDSCFSYVRDTITDEKYETNNNNNVEDRTFRFHLTF